ncbi:hypothetical protein C8F04DRAFT_1188128 [Mycena alexandri]|uniref:Uncharacterized protein n=1 Tax=Mycena alexandri TaxID=1745969 RepID=A0AAD6SKA4_9AGAR|nr:hypothetical protein C8F04DRAFT_1188128 [Mycena alexandri]
MYPPTTVVYPPDDDLSTLILWCTPHTARITYFVYPNTPVYPIHLEYHPTCLPYTPYTARITYFVYLNTPLYPIHLEYHPICPPCTPYAARITHLSTQNALCTPKLCLPISLSPFTLMVYPIHRPVPHLRVKCAQKGKKLWGNQDLSVRASEGNKWLDPAIIVLGRTAHQTTNVVLGTLEQAESMPEARETNPVSGWFLSASGSTMEVLCSK